MQKYRDMKEGNVNVMSECYTKGKRNKPTRLVLRLTKEPNDAFVRQARFVDWVDLKDGAQTSRIPQPCTYKYSLRDGFQIGDVKYRSFSELRDKVLNEERHLYQDTHGRIFAEVRKRFPCFDSFDYANENRFYHWLYLTENGKISLVYYEDEREDITVTEDISKIESVVWGEMIYLGWVKDVKVQVITGFLGAPE